MTQNEIEKLLVEVVCEIQNLSGRVAVPVSNGTRPVLDMPGFDSLNGVEATVDVVDRLQQNLDFSNVFVDNDRALTIQEAAARLFSCANKKSRT